MFAAQSHSDDYREITYEKSLSYRIKRILSKKYISMGYKTEEKRNSYFIRRTEYTAGIYFAKLSSQMRVLEPHLTYAINSPFELHWSIKSLREQKNLKFFVALTHRGGVLKLGYAKYNTMNPADQVYMENFNSYKHELIVGLNEFLLNEGINLLAEYRNVLQIHHFPTSTSSLPTQSHALDHLKPMGPPATIAEIPSTVTPDASAVSCSELAPKELNSSAETTTKTTQSKKKKGRKKNTGAQMARNTSNEDFDALLATFNEIDKQAASTHEPRQTTKATKRLTRKIMEQVKAIDGQIEQFFQKVVLCNKISIAYDANELPIRQELYTSIGNSIHDISLIKGLINDERYNAIEYASRIVFDAAKVEKILVVLTANYAEMYENISKIIMQRYRNAADRHLVSSIRVDYLQDNKVIIDYLIMKLCHCDPLTFIEDTTIKYSDPTWSSIIRVQLYLSGLDELLRTMSIKGFAEDYPELNMIVTHLEKFIPYIKEINSNVGKIMLHSFDAPHFYQCLGFIRTQIDQTIALFKMSCT